jgi:hypothetical protein
MQIANLLPLPQELRGPMGYLFNGSQKVTCFWCGQRTLRKHLVVCKQCGRTGCEGCFEKGLCGGCREARV